MLCYIAGPMTGYHRYNFDAFDEAAKTLRDEGWRVINPAEISREYGVDPDKEDIDQKLMNTIISRDVDAIFQVATVFLLPGWEKSTGATAEVALAKWLKKEVVLFNKRITPRERRILEIAEMTVSCLKGADTLGIQRRELEGLIKSFDQAKQSPID
jgi:hypothetical protein